MTFDNIIKETSVIFVIRVHLQPITTELKDTLKVDFGKVMLFRTINLNRLFYLL